MSKIKISELFYSIQGEGRYMGVPSVFLRTFGCNFTCDGFGMPRGEKSDEREIIAQHADQYTDYKSLPLVTTGCDSYASWDVRFKHLSPVVSVDGIVDAILHMLPHGKWTSEHLVITGGEPLLGWQRAYPSLLSHPDMVNLQELTFETNGTQELTDEFGDFLHKWVHFRRQDALTFSVSPKLSVSGEKWSDAIKPKIVAEYQQLGYVYLKFVVATEEDVTEAEQAVKEYTEAGFKGPVYLMPVGGVESVYAMNNKNVALMAMKKGWRYSDRLQVPLFKNEWGT
jgi:7-carboxy-7-deazaguanine synthase